MTELQKYTVAKVAKITDIKEAVKVKNMADAAEIFYKAQDAWEQAQEAQEFRLRAIRAAGKILLPPAQGGMTERINKWESKDSQYLLMLEEAGISHGTAQTWQKVARVPDDKFEAYFAEAEYWQDDFSIAGLLRFSGDWYGKTNITEWETPQWLFDLLDGEFHFDIDVCANEHNTKCQNYYSPERNGLKQDWEDFTCWMNPPYGREIKDWMNKASDSAKKGATVVCLVPARPDTEWWWDNCINGEIRFIKGRLKWPESETVAPFPSVIVILGSAIKPKVIWWDVQSKQR